jgi:hypothetical protein
MFTITLISPFGMNKWDSVNITISNEIIDSLHIPDSTIKKIAVGAYITTLYSLKEQTSYEINHAEDFTIFIFKNKEGVSLLSNVWYFFG